MTEPESLAPRRIGVARLGVAAAIAGSLAWAVLLPLLGALPADAVDWVFPWVWPLPGVFLLLAGLVLGAAATALDGPDRQAGWTAIMISVGGGLVGLVVAAYEVGSHISEGM